MAKVPQTLISIATLFLLMLMLANMAHSQTTHFQAPPFDDLTFQGDAFVNALIPTSPFISLTRAVTDTVGRVLYSKPFEFWVPGRPGKQVEFETNIKFKISPTDDYSKPLADGIVFFIAPKGSTIPDGSSGGNFGIFNSSGTGDSIFAVEIDTFHNAWDPPITLGLDRHIGIDINSHNSSSFGSLDYPFLGKEMSLSIKYAENTITVTLLPNEVITYEINLSTLLPLEVQVGIAASTGSYVSLQDIYYWDFTANMPLEGTVDGAGIRQVVST